jgi:hypothetical protein
MEILIVIGVLGLLALWTTATITFNGWVLSILWGWFIVPLGGPVLTIPFAIGVAVIVHLLTYQYDTAKDERDTATKVGHAVGVTLLSPLLALLIGWVALKFI